jgi:putative transposase
MVYHVLNRGNGRQDLFHKGGDFDAFLRVLNEGLGRYPVALLAYCLMSNHWHLVLRPGPDATALGRLMGWVGVTHVRRHHEHYHTRGGGHLYQGRFKSFPVQDDDHHLLTLCRYVESNPLRTGLVPRAEDWPFSSLRWSAGLTDGPPPVPLAPWPADRPADWLACVNDPLPEADAANLQIGVAKGRPFGDDSWVRRTVADLGLTHTLRPAGRPTTRRGSLA